MEDRFELNSENLEIFNTDVEEHDIKLGDKLEIIRVNKIFSHWAICVEKNATKEKDSEVGQGNVYMHLWEANGEGTFSWNDNHQKFLSVFKIMAVITWPLYHRTWFKVRRDFSESFKKGSMFNVDNSMDIYFNPLTGENIACHIGKELDYKGYNLVYYNCEHFVNRGRYSFGNWEFWASEEINKCHPLIFATLEIMAVSRSWSPWLQTLIVVCYVLSLVWYNHYLAFCSLARRWWPLKLCCLVFPTVTWLFMAAAVLLLIVTLISPALYWLSCPYLSNILFPTSIYFAIICGTVAVTGTFAFLIKEEFVRLETFYALVTFLAVFLYFDKVVLN